GAPRELDTRIVRAGGLALQVEDANGVLAVDRLYLVGRLLDLHVRQAGRRVEQELPQVHPVDLALLGGMGQERDPTDRLPSRHPVGPRGLLDLGRRVVAQRMVQHPAAREARSLLDRAPGVLEEQEREGKSGDRAVRDSHRSLRGWTTSLS